MLLDAGADVNERNDRGETALMMCTRHVDRQADKVMAELLVARGADYRAFDDFGHSALHAAAIGDSQPVLEYLLSLGLPVDMKDDEKGFLQTPLYSTAARCPRCCAAPPFPRGEA